MNNRIQYCRALFSHMSCNRVVFFAGVVIYSLSLYIVDLCSYLFLFIINGVYLNFRRNGCEL